MSFTAICWLIVKICLGLIALFLSLGFIAKAVSTRREKKYDLGEKDD